MRRLGSQCPFLWIVFAAGVRRPHRTLTLALAAARQQSGRTLPLSDRRLAGGGTERSRERALQRWFEAGMRDAAE
eukprot:644980-Pleurochrysis_carterae.AAC.1